VTTPDVALAELAARQHGVVAVAQLQALGFGVGAINYRPGSGLSTSFTRGLRRWSPPTVAACQGDGGGARLRA
jgi:hypothetical protein